MNVEQIEIAARRYVEIMPPGYITEEGAAAAVRLFIDDFEWSGPPKLTQAVKYALETKNGTD